MSLALSSLAIAVLAAVLYALFQKSAPTFSLLVSMAAALILLARSGVPRKVFFPGLSGWSNAPAEMHTAVCCAVRASFC